ncbi:hypothetical protein CTEN210_06422 [Chaetoceros tenuissimus]|uniref:Amine oxidase domain-containing protein n=1 Tax=Chaetoceros tenuissimus TaxID=426638 RepID=A0AAD3CPT3_9STRA|nr:hypothetical protein CTEN210_06422 [Chaetoceros tenuissimus]
MGVENYTILEASDCFGGRIKKATGFVEDIPLDIGAEWIHSPNHDIVNDILVFKPKENDVLTSQDFLKYQPTFYFRKWKSRLLSCLYKETKWNGLSWYDWLDEYVYAHVKEKIKYNSQVVRIEYSEKNVKVTTKSGKVYVADKVICTLPLAVLKTDDVIFHPALPRNKLEAIEKVVMPPGFKMFIEMKEKFYNGFIFDNSLCEQLVSLRDDNLCVFYDALEGKSSPTKHVLGCIVTGSNTRDFDGLSDDEALRLILSKLDKIFDGKATENYISFVIQNWSHEPYIKGTYSSYSSSESKKALRETLCGSLFFAGEHVSENYTSMVTGACIEGRRAAVEAICRTTS